MTLLIVAHMPSANTRAMGESLLRGAQQSSLDDLSVALQSPFETMPEHVRDASGIILMTPENLGYMSGALKDFFDRCYYPCLDHTQGLAYALVIRAGHDGTGTKLGIERIVTGLRWRAAAEPVICKGAWRPDFEKVCGELGQAMAEGIDAGIF